MAAKLDELHLDIQELTKVSNYAQRQRVKNILSIEVRKLETELVQLKERLQPEGITASSSKPSSAEPKCYETKITNYAWDQSDKFVKIFVTLKNVESLPSEQVYCNFSQRGVELHVKGLENRNYVLPVVNLLDSIDETKSYWKRKTDRVTVFLAKATISKHWSHLTASEVKPKEPKVPKGDLDVSSGLMGIIKNMYEEGDDEMKRIIAKACVESGEKRSFE